MKVGGKRESKGKEGGKGKLIHELVPVMWHINTLSEASWL